MEIKDCRLTKGYKTIVNGKKQNRNGYVLKLTGRHGSKVIAYNRNYNNYPDALDGLFDAIEAMEI